VTTTQTAPAKVRLAVSKKTAAVALDCSIDHIERLIGRGILEKIQIGPRKVAIRWSSLERLIGVEA
jgi:hypothetical protein